MAILRLLLGGKGRLFGYGVYPEEIHPEGPAVSKGNTYHQYGKIINYGV